MVFVPPRYRTPTTHLLSRRAFTGNTQSRMGVPVDLADCSLGVMNHGPYNLILQDNSLSVPPRLSPAQILTLRDSIHHRLHRIEPHLIRKIHHQHNLAPSPTPHHIQRRLRWLLLGLLRVTRQPQTLALTHLILLLVGIRCLIMVIGLILLTPTCQLHHHLRLPYPLSMNCWPCQMSKSRRCR